MKNYYDLSKDYGTYIDNMTTKDASTIFTFEEYVNHLFSAGKISESELKSCYTYDGYFIEQKFNVDHDYMPTEKIKEQAYR